jgi:hypothetical protein
LRDVLPEHLQSPCVTEEKTKENVQLEWIWWPTNYLSTTLFSSQIYPKGYMHCIVLCVDNNSYHIFLLASYPLFPPIGFALDS